MKINPISNLNFIQNTQKGKAAEPKEENQVSKDKIEISSEAKIKHQEKMESEKLEAIQNKIANKFYDSDEVIGKVAEGLLKDIKASE